MIISQETDGDQSTSSASWTPIAGLVLRVPPIVGETVLFVLNVPNPRATGSNYPGGNFGLAFNGEMQAPFAAFSYSQQSPASPGRVPVTLCVPTKLTGPLTVTAMWSSIRNSTVHLDGLAVANLTMVV